MRWGIAERNWQGSLRRIGAALALIGAAILLDRRSAKPIHVGTLKYPLAGSDNPLDRLAFRKPDRAAADLADAGLYGGLFLPFHLVWHPRPRQEWDRLFLAWLEMLLLNVGITSLIKNSANRPRPYILHPEFDNRSHLTRNDRAAFLSGHTSHATAGATLFALMSTRYTENKILEDLVFLATGVIAGGTGFLRVKAAKHWPTDAIAGALLGHLVGRFAFAMHFGGGVAAGARPGEGSKA